jgi:methylamine dehydrogenase accessory protein MauD
VLIVVRLGLAAVLVVAGVAKLLDGDGSRRALAGFGVPARLVRPLALALPPLELAIGIALVPVETAVAAAIAAAVLFGAFAVAIGLALARGERPDCHCFGALHSAPAGPLALARNVALGALAATVAVAGPGDSLADVDATSAGIAVAVLALLTLVGLTWFAWQLFRQNGRLLERVAALEEAVGLEGPAAGPRLPRPQAGDPAPEFELPSLDGDTVTLAGLLERDLRVALVFTDPDCPACDDLLPELARIQRARASDLTVVLVGRGDPDANAARLNGHRAGRLLLQEENEVGSAYGVYGYPAAVTVDRGGLIETAPVLGAEPIARLLDDGDGGPPEIEVLPVSGR